MDKCPKCGEEFEPKIINIKIIKEIEEPISIFVAIIIAAVFGIPVFIWSLLMAGVINI